MNGTEKKTIMVINFERGKDPRNGIGIGVGPQIDKFIEGLLDKLYMYDDKSIAYDLSDRISAEFSLDIKLSVIGNIGGGQMVVDSDERKLLVVCKSINYRKEFTIPFLFPTFQKVAARTVGMDLVPVIPMSKPMGNLSYLDYKYGRNWFSRILDKIKYAIIRKRKKSY